MPLIHSAKRSSRAAQHADRSFCLADAMQLANPDVMSWRNKTNEIRVLDEDSDRVRRKRCAEIVATYLIQGK